MLIRNLITAYILLSTAVLMAQTPAEPLNNDSLTKSLNALKKEVDELKNLKITGWVQAQLQFADSNGVANFDGGNFAPNADKRFMIRRGRIKFTYNQKNSQYVMQINGTERGLNLTEIYASFTEPWLKSFSIVTGVMNRPFGFEIDQSSAVRESPERSRYTQILMPNERDMGAKLVYVAPKNSKLNGLRLDAGFYNGQGVYVPGTSTPSGYPAGNIPVLGVNEFDFGKDFIGRLSYYKGFNNDKIKIGIGTSHYNGGNIAQNNVVYNSIGTDSLGVKSWKAADTSSTMYKGKILPRIYYGAEAFFSIKTPAGTTTLRGEYVTGTQTGTSGSSSSPFFLPAANTPMYVRNFSSFYAYFIQRIGESKHEVVVKYEGYDPNTKVTGKDLLGPTRNNLSSADIKYTQLAFGYNYYLDTHVKFMVFYNMIKNEVAGNGTTGIAGFTKDIKDNIFTIRMQYRF
ncbi:MAG: hypothetical protein ACJ76F_14245 [Bacteroidia bacterium]